MAEETPVPADLLEALSAVPGALERWYALTPLGRRDFIGWINGAKQPQTRAKRIGICRENLLKGKRRPCCYAVVPMDLYKALGEDSQAKEKWSALNADQKRDFSDWLESAEDKAERRSRVFEACRRVREGEIGP